MTAQLDMRFKPATLEELLRASIAAVKAKKHKFGGARLEVLQFLGRVSMWYTVQEISIVLKGRYAETGISAYIRELRKPKYGGHDVQCRLRAGTKRTYEYRLVAVSSAATYEAVKRASS